MQISRFWLLHKMLRLLNHKDQYSTALFVERGAEYLTMASELYHGYSYGTQPIVDELLIEMLSLTLTWHTVETVR